MTSTLDAGLDLRSIPDDRLPAIANAVADETVKLQALSGGFIDTDAVLNLDTVEQMRLYAAVIDALPTGVARIGARAYFHAVIKETRP